jgi:hypothetical protein
MGATPSRLDGAAHGSSVSSEPWEKKGTIDHARRKARRRRPLTPPSLVPCSGETRTKKGAIDLSCREPLCYQLLAPPWEKKGILDHSCCGKQGHYTNRCPNLCTCVSVVGQNPPGSSVSTTRGAGKPTLLPMEPRDL